MVNLVKPLQLKLKEVIFIFYFFHNNFFQKDLKIKDLIQKNTVLANYVTNVKSYRADSETIKGLKKSFEAVKIATSKIVRIKINFGYLIIGLENTEWTSGCIQRFIDDGCFV